MALLICEDDALIALELSEEAARRSIDRVVVVANSDDALRVLETDAFDAAIVDLHLADGRSGPQIARRLADRKIHTVILSGGELHCEELADAAHIFIRKPAPADIIVDCAELGFARV